jgi:ParB/RepB/Spo0J family partition protein
MNPIAHVFKDGDRVTIKADATKINGNPLPQAGKRGVIIGCPSPGHHIVDVPGMTVVNLLAEQLEQAPAAGSAAVITDVVAKGEAAMAPVPLGQADQPYGFDVLPRGAIVASLTNPRTWFEPVALNELAESIKAVGLAQPLLVRRLPGARAGETWSDRRKGDPLPTHELVSGERRWRACGIAGVRTIPVLIRDLTDEQVLDLQLVENMQRKDLHPMEEAQGYRRILDLPQHASQSMELRVANLAGRIKKSTRYIYQTLQLLQLCDFAQKVFLAGQLEKTTALQVATIGNEPGQVEATRRIAGLGPKGMDVINDPMSQRAAAAYVRDTFRLVLSKAPFPVKVEYAGVGACTTCPKMSSNARELFDEGTAGPDTCMDPSCYGKKNSAHTLMLAEAAKAKGQRVITGAAAKKLTISYQPDTVSNASGYESIDAKRWDAAGKNEGKTVAQLLGNDAPAPVLIERPDGKGFIKALPKKDVDRLLKERGLVKVHTSSKDKAREEEKKAKAIKAYRWAVAEQLLQAVPAAKDQDALRAQLLLAMMVQLHQRLDNECTKRVHKLLAWESRIGLHVNRPALETHFKSLDGTEINRFVVAACVASELHYAQYFHPTTEALDSLAELLKVDAKAIKAAQDAEAKAAKKAKEERSKPKSKAKLAKAAQAAATPAAAAPAGTDVTTYAVGDAVRFKQGLRGHANHFRKVCGRAGTIESVTSEGAYIVRTGNRPDERHRAEAAELEFHHGKPALNAKPAAAAKKTSKGTPAENQLGLELPSAGTLSPQPAWPFPTLAKAPVREAAAGKAASAGKDKAAVAA